MNCGDVARMVAVPVLTSQSMAMVEVTAKVGVQHEIWTSMRSRERARNCIT
jgi:hypothetical protein